MELYLLNLIVLLSKSWVINLDNFKRTIISLKRQKIKTIILFFILLCLGTLISVAVSISHGISSAEFNLRSRIPAVARFVPDIYLISDYLLNNNFEFPKEFYLRTSETIHEIGALPQVRLYDFTYSNYFWSNNLSKSSDIKPYLPNLDQNIANQLLESFNFEFYFIERFELRGVHNHLLLDSQVGNINLIEGRTFTKEEINKDSNVAIIPEALALENNLNLGSVIYLDKLILDNWNFQSCEEFKNSINVQDELRLEIIGIFTPRELNNSPNFIEVFNHMFYNNLIYVPLNVAKSYDFFRMKWMSENNDPTLYYWRAYHGYFYYENVVYILYDSLNLKSFINDATDIIPNFWIMKDLSRSFIDMTASLNNLNEISNLILLGTISASILIIGFIITIFIYDRKNEIGVYLSLGEHKSKILAQLGMEIIFVSLIVIIISIFSGYLVSRQFSNEILINEIRTNSNQQNLEINDDFNSIGFGFWMTQEEMLETYSVSFNGIITVKFMGITFLTIMVSLVLPFCYLIKISPQRLLLKSAIG